MANNNGEENLHANSLATVLTDQIKNSGIKRTDLARRANISAGTLRNWCDGTTGKPQQWQGLARCAKIMLLDVENFSRLLKSANHKTIKELWLSASGDTPLKRG